MAGIEQDNPALKGVLPKDYGRHALDKTRLGQLLDLISNIKGGDEASRTGSDVCMASVRAARQPFLDLTDLADRGQR